MCGIAGSLGPRAPSPEAVERTLRTMRRRGPDVAGTWQGPLGNRCLTLLHTRLAIIDLDLRSSQPFKADGCVLIFNGEIYNYLELRRELMARGETFKTQSDTEVVLKAYRAWGADCAQRFEGMWALALFDERTQELWLSRDRFGEKPLYTMKHGDTFYFGSEVKQLAALSGHVPPVNPDQIARYLVNGYKSLYKQPQTFFLGVADLPAGSSAVIRDGNTLRPERYWMPRYAPHAISRDDAVAGARACLAHATELSLRADVPVAFCLSGGVDSGALCSLAVRRLGCDVHAFSIIDSDHRYDESDNIDHVVAALGCRHTAIETSRVGFFERLGAQIGYHDAPVSTISYYIHNFLSEAIAANGCKVAISGTAADEIFTGYYDHYSFWLASQAGHPDFDKRLDEWRGSFGQFVRNRVLRDPLVFANNPCERGHIYLDRDLFASLASGHEAEEFFEETYTDDPLRNRMLNELEHEVVPMILREDDLNSMYYSVENRSPYLNPRLVDFMAAVPSEHLFHNGYSKSVLREAVEGILPDEVRLDRQKKGFNASILSLVDPKDKRTRATLLDSSSAIFDYVDHDRFLAFVDGDLTDNARSKFLFSFISAKTFLESDLARGRLPH
jgi:asparagine synthase (glutamine-hydrolysing)